MNKSENKGIRLALVIAMISCFCFQAVIADDMEDEKKKTAESVVNPMGAKMVRGITNCATGWCEIPRQVVLSAQEDGALLMLPYGLTRGITMTVVRTVYGALEVAFFYIPFGGDYESCLKPAYVWQADEDDEEAGE